MIKYLDDVGLQGHYLDLDSTTTCKSYKP